MLPGDQKRPRSWPELAPLCPGALAQNSRSSGASGVQDWDARNIEEGVRGDSSRVFESTVDLPENSTALVGYIELRNDIELSNGELWCSSGHWAGANGATNWDLLVIPLPEGITQGPLSLKSTVKAFTTEPNYALDFSAGETSSFSVELEFPKMFGTQCMPRLL